MKDSTIFSSNLIWNNTEINNKINLDNTFITTNFFENLFEEFLKKRYNITLEEFDYIIKEQNPEMFI